MWCQSSPGLEILFSLILEKFASWMLTSSISEQWGPFKSTAVNWDSLRISPEREYLYKYAELMTNLIFCDLIGTLMWLAETWNLIPRVKGILEIIIPRVQVTGKKEYAYVTPSLLLNIITKPGQNAWKNYSKTLKGK